MHGFYIRWLGCLVFLLTGLSYGQSPVYNVDRPSVDAARAADPENAPPLRDLADGLGLWLGPAVAYNPLLRETDYADALRREFNFVTAENAMKWNAVHPQRDRYTFTQADAIADFATANGMGIHGHTLVWHSGNPGWLTSGAFTREEMIEILRDHIRTVAGRYRGRVLAWDVVNEAVNGDGSLRTSFWRTRLGDDYIHLAFQFAQDADPDACLVYNDYGAETVNAKSTGIYNLLSDMLSRGLPVHGVGFQMHLGLNGIDLQSFARNMQRFADLGLLLFITEMDVRIPLPVTEAKLAQQAEVYRGVLDACLAQPACVGFQTWGFTDKHSWIPGTYPGYGAALILDEDYNPKPAYTALSDLLSATEAASRIRF